MVGSGTGAQWWLQVVHKQEIEILALQCLLDCLKQGKRGKPFIARFNFFSKEGHLAIRIGGTYIFISNLKSIDTCT